MREKTVYTLGILGTLLLLWNFYQIFLVIPIDALQGEYFPDHLHPRARRHSPRSAFMESPWSASIAFLMTKNFNWDSMAVSAVEVGTMFTLVNLATGSIWGRVEWGIWWAWDARMTSQLMCFLLYLGYLLMRPAIAEPQQRGVDVGRSRDLRRRRHSDRRSWRSGCTMCGHSTPARCSKPGGLAPVYWPPFLIGDCGVPAARRGHDAGPAPSGIQQPRNRFPAPRASRDLRSHVTRRYHEPPLPVFRLLRRMADHDRLRLPVSQTKPAHRSRTEPAEVARRRQREAVSKSGLTLPPKLYPRPIVYSGTQLLPNWKKLFTQ